MSSSTQPKYSLVRKLTSWVILVVSLPLAALFAAALYYDQSREAERLQKNMQNAAQLNSAALARGLLDANVDLIQPNLNVLTGSPDITYAAVLNVNDETIAESGTLQENQNFLYQQPLKHRNQTASNLSPPQEVGTLVLAADHISWLQRNRQNAGLLLVAWLILSGLLTMMLTTLFRRALAPFEQISDFLSRAPKQPLDAELKPLQLNRRASNNNHDEFQVLTDLLNHHQVQTAHHVVQHIDKAQRLEQTLHQQEHASDKLQQKNQEIITVMDNLGHALFVVNRDKRIVSANQVAMTLFEELEQPLVSDAHLDEVCQFQFDTATTSSRFNLSSFFDSSKSVSVIGYCYLLQSEPFPCRLVVSPEFSLNDQACHSLIITDETRTAVAGEAAYYATHDFLTGVHSQISFNSELKDILDEKRALSEEFTICLLNFEEYPEYSKRLGHLRADRLLTSIARTIQNCLRDCDHLARLYSSTFGIILNDGINESLIPCERITLALSELEFPNPVLEESEAKEKPTTTVISLTAQIGLTPLYIDDELEAIYTRVERALRTARNQGGGIVRQERLGSDNEEGGHHDETFTISSMKELLSNDKLSLFAQTIVPLDKPSTVGHRVELLLRFIREDKGRTISESPYSYLKVASKYHLTHLLDGRMIDLTIRHLIDREIEAQYVHINLAARSLLLEPLQNKLFEVLSLASKRKKTFCIEINLHELQECLEPMLPFLLEARERGAKLAVEDCGPEISEAPFLDTLPLDFIKIRGALVEAALQDDTALDTLRSIQVVGQQIDAQCVAEHIPDHNTLTHLRELGIQFGQTFLLSQPAPLRPTDLDPEHSSEHGETPDQDTTDSKEVAT